MKTTQGMRIERETLPLKKSRVRTWASLWLSAIATITVAACSSGGGGSNGQHHLRRPSPSPTPMPYNYNANGPSQLDKQSSRSQQEAPTSADATNSDHDQIEFSDDGSGSQVQPARSQHPHPATKARRLNRAGVTRTQAPVDADGPYGSATVDSSESNSGASYYSSASNDNLRAQVEAVAPNGSGDNTWASELSKGMVYFTPQSREIEIDALQTRPAGDQYKIILRGIVGQDGRGYLPDNGSQISGAVECLDLNGGCESAHVKIINSAYSPAREAHMIIRTTNSALTTIGNGFDISHNHEYDWFLNILVNTGTRASDAGRVSRLVVETSETIHGVSNVSVGMTIVNVDRTESVYFNGPLVRSNGGALNAPMIQTAANPFGLERPISNTISNISLIANDGLGDLQVALTIRAVSPSASPDTITLKLDRIQNAIRSATAL